MYKRYKDITKQWIYLIVGLCFSLPTLSSQEVILTGSKQILQSVKDQEGRIYIGYEREVCIIESNQAITNCIELPFSVEGIKPIGNHSFVAWSGRYVAIINNERDLRLDILPEIISKIVKYQNSLLIATSDGIYSYQLNNFCAELFSLEGHFINDISEVFESKILVALDNGTALIAIDGKVILRNEKKSIIRRLAQNHSYATLLLDEKSNLLLSDKNGRIKDTIRHQFTNVKDIYYYNNNIVILNDKEVVVMDENNSIEFNVKGNFNSIVSLDHTLLLASEFELVAYDLVSKNYLSKDIQYSILPKDHETYYSGGTNKFRIIQKDKTIKEWAVSSKLKELPISSIQEYGNHIFLGTLGDGLYIYTNTGVLQKRLHFDDIPSKNNVIQLKKIGNTIWVAYLNGIYLINAITFEIIKEYDHILGNRYLYCFEPISNDEFYIGTSHNGVLHYYKNSLKNIIENNTIYSMALAHDTLWVGTESSGIFALKNKKIIYNLPSNPVYSIQSRGNILYVCEKQNVKIINTRNKLEIPIQTEALQNGLLSGTGLVGYHVYVGFQNGVKVINTERATVLSNTTFHLNQPMQFNKTLPIQQTVFEYDHNSISFSFFNEVFIRNIDMHYKYRLIGLDTNWNLTHQNNLDFYNLAPNKYTFELSSGYNENFIPTEVKVFSFEIKKPFWKTYAFLTITTLLTLSLLYYFVKWREKKIIENKQSEQERIKFELNQLKSQINPHFLFNILNSIIGLIEEDSEAAIAAIDRITAFYRKVLFYQNEDLIKISDEIELINDYCAIHKLRYEDYLQIHVAENLPKLGMLIPFSLQLLIENAIKHNAINREHNLHIYIDYKNDHLIIRNNINPKMNSTPQSGYGLQNLHSRYKLISNKKIKVTNKVKEFTVEIPILHD